MSERMIPLKIADMAVAACNEEIAKLQAENARLKAEVERLGEENKTRQKDMELLFASYKQALEDIRRLHWDLQTAKKGKQS